MAHTPAIEDLHHLLNHADILFGHQPADEGHHHLIVGKSERASPFERAVVGIEPVKINSTGPQADILADALGLQKVDDFLRGGVDLATGGIEVLDNAARVWRGSRCRNIGCRYHGANDRRRPGRSASSAPDARRRSQADQVRRRETGSAEISILARTARGMPSVSRYSLRPGSEIEGTGITVPE